MSTSRRTFLSLASAGAASTLFPDLIRDALAVPANNVTGTIADVEHVVIFMQENRSFDHYFGSFPGVRGFDDPRAITLPGGRPVWYQPDAAGGHVLPFHFDAKNTSALSLGTDHSWKGSQASWQGWDAWVKKKSPQCMGYFDRGDLPFYYALADAFSICDAYHCSIFGPTDPNRFYSLSGTSRGRMGALGGLYNISGAGYYNNDPKYDNLSPAVTASAPTWRTYAEILEANDVSWKVYQEWDNYGDNYLAYFRQFRVNPDGSRLAPDSPLARKGRVLAPGSTEANSRGTKGDWLVADFANDVRDNRLPKVSWIVAPNDYTEHSPNSPNAGENLTARLLAALVANPAVWSKTVFLLTYDENDGFFDHVPPNIPPLDPAMGRTTLAEIGADENLAGVPVGLGPRVPMLVISPWSKGGRVCSQVFDHTSKLRFLEEWLTLGLKKNRASVTLENISPWRRVVCGDLTSAFDFKSPNSAWPASVPKSTQYQLVSGKPYPTPPAQQTLPLQEPCKTVTRTRHACALPYVLSAHAAVNPGKQLELSLHNSGKAGAAFIVYSSVRTDGPWYYTVEAGKRIDREVWNWTGGQYHLSVTGPNGFLRELAGNLAATGARPEVQVNYDLAGGNVQLLLSNAGATAACTFTMLDNAYGAAATTYTVAAGQQQAVQCLLAGSFGWYDYSIGCDADPRFLRRVAGHVETGAPGRTDPAIGANRRRVVLTASASVLQRGASLSVTYAAPAGKLDPKNWVGLFPASAKPGAAGQGALQWAYVPAANGTHTFSTAALAVGDYAVWYFHQGGYTALGEAVTVSVTQFATSTPAVKRGAPLVFTLAMPASRVAAKNWVGVYRAGTSPGAGSSAIWQYTAQAGATVTFDSSSLTPGTYSVWLLHNDGYGVLGGPLAVSVA
ncbi:phospholipase C, phosphocholine-specific [Massilia violaceinigra]|uniref:phospholipase C n=1 Tax=Massilia violaceinigra TaxID=2045208 RepID=A0A2D2DRU1_9BURK|nr:phospholipase C, phosphocholine-specific [Massilia violaceinigra]ATQ77700.1 phospholipase C, phosphocholine-specific [Massilia violaceinigra]